MPNYYEGSMDGYDDSDVTWSMQEAVLETAEGNLNGFLEVDQPKDLLGYRSMAEGKEKRKKKKRRDREREKVHRKSHEFARTEGVGVNKDVGYGLGLSRGFSLWRTLKDIRHCITKVSDPMTKAQRRSLRRKLSYYVDDMERIVVGVNPRAPETNSEDVFSGDEEMREEVNALIDDALDEATLQGKIVQSDYFETRMSYLEQRFATLKEQLEEVASKKVQEQDKQEANEPKKQRMEEEDVRDAEKVLGRGQTQKRVRLKKQSKEGASKDFVQEEVTSENVQVQDKQEANEPKKQLTVEDDVRDAEKVLERGQMQKRVKLKKQLKEVASKKFVQEEVASEKVQEKVKQESNGPKKQLTVEEDVRDAEKVLERGQMQKRVRLKKQLKEVASKKFVHEEVTSKKVHEQYTQEANGPKKRQMEEGDVRDDVVKRGRMQKGATPKIQLKEVASKKFVQKEMTSKKVQEQDKQDANEPEKRQMKEEDVRGDEKVLKRGQTQKSATPKIQLEEVASMKLVQDEVTSEKVQDQDKQEANGPKKRQMEEEDVRDDEKVLERGQMQCATLKNQLEQEEVTGEKVQEQVKQEPNEPMKRQMKEEYVRADEEVQEKGRGQMQKQEEGLQRVSKNSPTLHTSLCSLQAAVIHQHSNEGSAELLSDKNEDKSRKQVSSIEEEHTPAKGKNENEEPVEAELAKTLGQVEERSKDYVESMDQSQKIQEEVSSNKPFRGWGVIGRPRGRGRGRGRGKNLPAILKRINLNY